MSTHPSLTMHLILVPLAIFELICITKTSSEGEMAFAQEALVMPDFATFDHYSRETKSPRARLNSRRWRDGAAPILGRHT